MIADAPWIGKCKEDYYGYEPELLGYCECCSGSIYDDDEYTEIDGTLYCKECMRRCEMLEGIIAKLCNYLGDIYGFEYDDLKQSCGLTESEIACVKEIVEDE